MGATHAPHLHRLTAPIVNPPGNQLPGLLGARTLMHERAILDMGAKRLIFPGPGEVKMIMPPGSIVIPLEQAPSGHLVMPIDEFNKVTKATGGTPSASLSLISTDAHEPPPTTLTSGSSTDAAGSPVVLNMERHLTHSNDDQCQPCLQGPAEPITRPPGLEEIPVPPTGRDLRC